MNFSKILFISLALPILLIISSCLDQKKEDNNDSSNESKSLSEEELYRPIFHFTPRSGWMNDPNGMFYYNGVYHMYYQYYPDSNVWGPMHWGHAVSTDLVKWEEKEIALFPDEKGYIFSGSAIVDTQNTSGFGTKENPPIVAMYTYHDPKGQEEGRSDYQTQAIAYSLDEGYTWTKYKANPVIKNDGLKNFRDPKVSWDPIHEFWLMGLSAGEETMFYKSSNMKDWEYLSNFGEGYGAHEGEWECPDFFPLKVEGSNETKWVLIQNINPGGLNGGSGVQYFIGDFDGTTFTLDDSFKKDLENESSIWIDYGRDNYAGVTWSNIPESDGRKLFIGWMSNWTYAQQVPTEQWRSSMTIARELNLKKYEGHYRIFSKPVLELDKYVKNTLSEKVVVIENEKNLIDGEDFNFKSLEINFNIKELQSDVYTFSLFNSAGDSISFGLNNTEKYFFSDRSKAGDLSFSDKFGSSKTIAPLYKELDELLVQIIIDKTSMEIFYNSGRYVMTEIFFPSQPLHGFSIKSSHKEFEIEDFIVKQLEF